jgi:hypothetical protein
MTTLNGQSFAQAFSAIWPVVNANGTPAAQPFFEAAMGGPTSPYCTGFANCTPAVASKENANIKNTVVYSMWLNLNRAPGWTLGRTMLAAPSLKAGDTAQQLSGAFDFISSHGHGNYNAGFMSFTARDWHGLTARSNLTYGRSLGTGSVVQASSSITVPNPFDFDRFGTYGTQPFDVKLTYSLLTLYQVPYFRSQKGHRRKVPGRLGDRAVVHRAQRSATAGIGRRQLADIWRNLLGSVLQLRERGRCRTVYRWKLSTVQRADRDGRGQPAQRCDLRQHRHEHVCRSGGGLQPIPSTSARHRHGFGRRWRDPGIPFWMLDATISKDIRVTESIGATLSFQFVNVLNHFVPADPTTNIDTPTTFGVVTNQYTTPNGSANRALEFGLRIRF